MKLIPVIPQDKANHFVYGTLLGAISCLAFGPILSIAITFLVGFGKEVWDKVSGTGTCDLIDLIVTMIGGMVVILPIIATNHIG